MRAGINTRNVAVSATASGWRWPTTCLHSLVILDADLNLKICRWPTRTARSRPRFGGHDAAPRSELRRRAEGCERSLGSLVQSESADIPAGMIHDFGTGRQVHPRLPQPAAQPARRNTYSTISSSPRTTTRSWRLAQRREERRQRPGGQSRCAQEDRRPRAAPACRTSVPASPGRMAVAGQTVMATPNLNERAWSASST